MNATRSARFPVRHQRQHAIAVDEPPATRSRCVTQLFEQQVMSTPDALAIFDDREQVTFRDLNARANRLAYALRARGVALEKRVGIALERSVDTIVALLGVMKAGGAYVPLDPAYPIARLALMIEDSDARCIITREQLRDLLPAGAPLFCLDSESDTLAQQRAGNPPCFTGPDHAAYVMYTSGTTGRPKGVVGLHRGIVNRCAWMWEAYPFAIDEVCCQKTSLSFVDSVAEILMPLLKGIPTVIVRDEVVRDPRWLVDIIAAHGVTRLVLVPSLLRDILALGSVLERRLAGLKICVSSGEALPVTLAHQFRERLPHATLLNLYGSTEVAADVTCYDTKALPPDATGVPLGHPIANTQMYILDSAMSPVAPNEAGELYVGGDGLARGYLGRPDLTEERFIPNPFAASPQARLYRTGDRARWLDDGSIAFLGRVDHQVKIRGFRVELPEVETVLATHPAVAQAVVAARRYGPSDTRLNAYVVTREGALFDADNLRRFLRVRLPEHMVPSAFVHLDALPLTVTGKVNREALPVADTTRSPGVSARYVAPRNPTEVHLMTMWQELLGVTEIGVTDDFFDLGGHSLLAVRLAAQIEDAYGRRFPVSTLAQTRTIERLAAILTQPETSSSWTPIVDLQPAGTSCPFFLVHGIGGEVLSFSSLARCMAPHQPFYGLRAKGADSVEEPLSDVESMAAYYIEAIRRVAPEGPYLIGGYSSGGTVALEMAQQLRARGERVALLVLIDADAPGTDGVAPFKVRHTFWYLRNFATWLVDDDFFGLGFAAMAGRVRSKVRVIRAKLARLLRKQDVPLDIRDALGVWMFPEGHRRFLEVHSRALAAYVPREYKGPMVLLRARTAALSEWRAPDLGWGALAKGGLAIQTIRGAHDNILTEPRVRTLAAKITACLTAASEQASVSARSAVSKPSRAANAQIRALPVQ